MHCYSLNSRRRIGETLRIGECRRRLIGGGDAHLWRICAGGVRGGVLDDILCSVINLFLHG